MSSRKLSDLLYCRHCGPLADAEAISLNINRLACPATQSDRFRPVVLAMTIMIRFSCRHYKLHRVAKKEIFADNAQEILFSAD